MPNWCANWGSLRPYNDEGKTVFEKLKKYEGYDREGSDDNTRGWMSFLLPCPKEMWLGVKVENGDMNVEIREEYLSVEWLQEHSEFDGDFGKLSEDEHGKKTFQASDEYRKYLLDTFGATNWYTWGNEHWGCKWDVDLDTFTINEAENTIVFDFLSAWCDPMKFFEWLRNHGVDYERGFEEPGEGWLGKEETKNGEVVHEEFYHGEQYTLYRIQNGEEVGDQLYDIYDYTSAEEYLADRQFKSPELIALIKTWYEENPSKDDEK